LFATDGHEINYLNQANQGNLERLLQREGLALENVDATLVAALFAKVLLTTGNVFHQVIASASDVFALAEPKSGGVLDDAVRGRYSGRVRGPSKSKSGYVLDDAERERYEGRVQVPSITVSAGGGWVLAFFTLGGWMHETTTVTYHVFAISLTYRITPHKEILTDRAFSQTPNILY
jgi:hypothetical protein